MDFNSSQGNLGIWQPFSSRTTASIAKPSEQGHSNVLSGLFCWLYGRIGDRTGAAGTRAARVRRAQAASRNDTIWKSAHDTHEPDPDSAACKLGSSRGAGMAGLRR